MQQTIWLRVKICTLLFVGIALFGVHSAYAAATKEMMLMPPQKDVGKPVMEALSLRKTNRNFSDQALSDQDLSNLLWAAWGANRADGRRTVPTARNGQKVTVYAVLKTGVWEYDGVKHNLTLITDKDFTSRFDAPLTLMYTAPKDSPDASGMHVGSMYQSVGLYCASVDLANGVKTSVRDALDGQFELPRDYMVYSVQLVGIPD